MYQQEGDKVSAGNFQKKEEISVIREPKLENSSDVYLFMLELADGQ